MLHELLYYHLFAFKIFSTYSKVYVHNKYILIVLFNVQVNERKVKYISSLRIQMKLYVVILKSYLFQNQQSSTDTDFQFVSYQHLNFEIQILLERGY